MVEVVKTQEHVTTRVRTFETRFERWKKAMQRLDNWRYMDQSALMSEIWRAQVPQNAARWTIIKPDIAATTETVISFTTSKRPKITVTARNTVNVPSSDAANQVERLGYAIYDTIERDRDTPWMRETFDHAFHRGAMVTKVLRLTPEERGAVTETIEPPAYDDPDIESDEDAMEVVVSEDTFPLLVQPIDPYECTWATAPDGRVIEFVHEYDDSIDNIIATFPAIDGKAEFAALTSQWMSNAKAKVTEYWDETNHCILINNVFFKPPTPHEYPAIPVVIDLAAPRTRRYSDKGQYVREGTPFCAGMLDSVAKLSMAESWMTANLEEVAFAMLTLEGIDPDDSPHMQPGADGKSEFTMQVQMGPSKSIIPLFKSSNGQQERLRYVEPPPVVPALMQFAGARLRDSSLLTFPESILSGAQTADLSGYAYAQMKQAAFSRLSPYTTAGDRHASRVLFLVNRLLIHDWDRGPDIALQLVQLVGQQNQAETTVEVTKEMLMAVGNIKVEIQPEMPVDLEKEWTMFFQAGAQGYMSAKTVMEKMGTVEDPTMEFEDMILERHAMNDPATQAAIIAKAMRRQGIQPVQPKAQAAPPPGAGPPGMAPPPGMDPSMIDPALAQPVMDPSLMGGDPAMQGGPPVLDPLAAQGGGMPPGGLPPELLAMLQQQGRGV